MLPDLPVSSSLSYIGVFLLIAGGFLFLAGLSVIKVEKISVLPGKRTTFISTFVMLFGLLFLTPDFLTFIKSTSSPKPVSTETQVAGSFFSLTEDTVEFFEVATDAGIEWSDNGMEITGNYGQPIQLDKDLPQNFEIELDFTVLSDQDGAEIIVGFTDGISFLPNYHLCFRTQNSEFKHHTNEANQSLGSMSGVVHPGQVDHVVIQKTDNKLSVYLNQHIILKKDIQAENLVDLNRLHYFFLNASRAGNDKQIDQPVMIHGLNIRSLE